ncbi:MAG: ATPase [Dinoroseobacter sp.]|uniref:DUF4175 domain-containing protein n=1 Tax=Alterinioella nitratireducens TaxID=2735915 RepID=UPI000C915FC0|nr:DUF4175 domain-containing protein [Alterinioella nitratireducens]MAN16033.1 ATPase [Dinoroseobacter sp.]NPD20055.1 DUF4175 domain-containing protein [Alterinioella nitratireducens]
MTDTHPTKRAALDRLVWPLRLTRTGMIAERFVRAYWPIWTILIAGLAGVAFGLAEALAQQVLWALLAVIVLALLWACVSGYRRFRMPTRAEALERLDATLPGRPISALIDHPAIGAGDPQAMTVWEVHIARMAARTSSARAPLPDLRVNDRDPYGLRFLAITAFAMALLFGTIWKVAEVGEAIAGVETQPTGGPSWEGWVEPPLYTGLPSLYLNDIEAAAFEAPAGSRITLRLYGDPGQIDVSQSLHPGVVPPGEDVLSRQFTLQQSGDLSIAGVNPRSWQITMIEDQPPSVTMAEPLSGVPPGSVQMTYDARDDYGIAGGHVLIALAPDRADRRYGLSVDPEPREPLSLELPLPFSGDRAEFTEILVEDLSEHPFANLPVRLTLTVEDDAGQLGQEEITVDRLPGRRFFDPLANALVEMRRDLLWSRENAPRVAQLLRAITYRGEDLFDDENAYRMVRVAIRRLEAGDSVSLETRDQVAEMLWEVALVIEEGDLADALERLRRAQDRLEEAMRQGASDEEIAQLMQELREAMDDYMQELADNMEPGDGTDEPDREGESMEISRADLEEMMERIEELMQQGRMAEAQELLDALREMMENMQMSQNGSDPNGPQSPGQEAMEGLQNSLRDQQGLADETFRDLQERFNPNAPAPDGQTPEGGQQGNAEGGEADQGTLAERQRQLREQLREQAQNLPGRGTPGGEEALRRLEEANRAMRDAIEELERGDLAEALDSQSEAMEGLREGMEELGRALAEIEEGEDPGQGQAEGNMQGERPLEDPLGRQAGNNGSMGTDQSYEEREEAFRRARDLLDEIRRRSADQTRPDVELEYLRRLLDRFATGPR